jgi:hypothetical protein
MSVDVVPGRYKCVAVGCGVDVQERDRKRIVHHLTAGFDSEGDRAEDAVRGLRRAWILSGVGTSTLRECAGMLPEPTANGSIWDHETYTHWRPSTPTCTGASGTPSPPYCD